MVAITTNIKKMDPIKKYLCSTILAYLRQTLRHNKFPVYYYVADTPPRYLRTNRLLMLLYAIYMAFAPTESFHLFSGKNLFFDFSVLD